MYKLKYTRVLNILSALFGFTGTIIMVLGVLTSSSNDIAKLGGLYFGINPHLLRSIAESRADTICGILLVSISFLLQLLLYVFENKIHPLFLNLSKRNIIKFSVLALLVVVGLWFLHYRLIENTIFSTHKEMAILSLTKQFNYNKDHNQTHNGKVVLGKGQIDVINGHMNDLSFLRKKSESELEYLKRFYNFLELDFVDEINFEESGIKEH